MMDIFEEIEQKEREAEADKTPDDIVKVVFKNGGGSKIIAAHLVCFDPFKMLLFQ